MITLSSIKLLKSFLSKLPLGNASLEFNFKAGSKSTLTVSVKSDTAYDAVAPSGIVTPDNTIWTNKDIILTCIGKDDVSGTGIDFITKPDNTTSYGDTTTYVATKNATYNFTITDVAGNIGTASYDVKNIDKTPPTGSITEDITTPTPGPVTLTCLGTDNESGMYSVSVLIPKKTLVNVLITKPAIKITYKIGETLDISGLEVTSIYSDGSKVIESITTSNISGFDSSKEIQNQTLSININGHILTYSIVVIPLSTLKIVAQTPFVSTSGNIITDMVSYIPDFDVTNPNDVSYYNLLYRSNHNGSVSPSSTFTEWRTVSGTSETSIGVVDYRRGYTYQFKGDVYYKNGSIYHTEMVEVTI